MIMAWLTTRVLGLAKGWWLLIVLGGLIAAVIIARGWMDRTIDTAVEAGAAEQREKTATATIQQVEKANAATDDLRRSDDARRAECLRNARNPADC